MSIDPTHPSPLLSLFAPRALESVAVDGVDPELLHLDAGWTPQGQAHDGSNGRDELLTTYYFDDRPFFNTSGDGPLFSPFDDSQVSQINGQWVETGVRLSIQDRQSGTETQQVTLLGTVDGEPAPAHGGGVATDGDYVYVADSGQTYVYSRAQIDAAQVNPDTGRVEVQALYAFDTPQLTDAQGETLVSSASYIAVEGNHAYVGGYSPDGDGKTGAVWRYEIGSDGRFIEPPQGPIEAPDRAQGVTVVDGGNGLLFTTGDRKLVYQPVTATDAPFATDGDRREVDKGQLDSWAQGISIVDGQLYVTYESGSWQYEGSDGRQEIQRIPLGDLDDFPA